MPLCPECGEFAQEGWKFCPKCAVQFPTPEPVESPKSEPQEVIMAAENIHHGHNIGKKVVNDPAAIIAAYEKGQRKSILDASPEDELTSMVERAKIVAGATGRDEKDVLADLMDDGIVNLSNREEGGFQDLYNLGSLSEREERFSRFIESVPGRIDSIREKDEAELLARIAKNGKKIGRKHTLWFILFAVAPILAVLEVSGTIDLSLTSLWQKWCLYCCGMTSALLLLAHEDDRTASVYFLGIYDHHRKEVGQDFESKGYSIGMVIPAYYQAFGSYGMPISRNEPVVGQIIDYIVEDDILLLQLVDGSTYELSGDFFVKRLFQTSRKVDTALLGGKNDLDIITEYFGRKILVFDNKFNFEQN
tara:strand:+ start:108 stop:1193 length:1086 start_codon:yes stop_codon:yes gene_type:complete